MTLRLRRLGIAVVLAGSLLIPVVVQYHGVSADGGAPILDPDGGVVVSPMVDSDGGAAALTPTIDTDSSGAALPAPDIALGS